MARLASVSVRFDNAGEPSRPHNERWTFTNVRTRPEWRLRGVCSHTWLPGVDGGYVRCEPRGVYREELRKSVIGSEHSLLRVFGAANPRPILGIRHFFGGGVYVQYLLRYTASL
jgi:hypothetical protein